MDIPDKREKKQILKVARKYAGYLRANAPAWVMLVGGVSVIATLGLAVATAAFPPAAALFPLVMDVLCYGAIATVGGVMLADREKLYRNQAGQTVCATRQVMLALEGMEKKLSRAFTEAARAGKPEVFETAQAEATADLKVLSRAFRITDGGDRSHGTDSYAFTLPAAPVETKLPAPPPKKQGLNL